MDSIHLYDMLNRNTLVVVSFNANNGIVHLTYTLVEEENNVNWRCSYFVLNNTLSMIVQVSI